MALSPSTGAAERVSDAARFFLLGLVSLVVQTVLVRESLFAFHGGEIGLGLFYAVWLGAIAAGARLGTSLVRRLSARVANAGAGGLFVLGLALLAWCGIAQVALFRLHRAFLPVAAGGLLPVPAYALLLLCAVAPAGVLTGGLFPVGLRAGAASAGGAYALESIGSMAGGALASLWLLPRVPAVPLLALVGVACAVGVLPAIARRVPGTSVPARGPGAIPATALFVLLLAFLVTGLASRVDLRLDRARWNRLETGTTPVASFHTPYSQVTVASLQGELSLYIDGLYQGAVRDPYVDSLTAAIVATQHPHPRRMLLLTPGFYGPARVLAGARGATVQLVRADAALDHAIAASLAAYDTAAARGEARVSLLTEDPRAAIRATVRGPQIRGGGWAPDLIAVLQGGPSSGAANRLYTQEFFADCARVLAAGGVLVVAIPGAANVASPEEARLRASIAAALEAVFEDVRIAPGTPHYLFATRPRGMAYVRMAASWPRGWDAYPLTWSPDSLAARRARLWPGETPWPPALFAGLFPAERVADLHQSVAREIAAGVCPNRDRDPIVYYEQLRRWDRLSGSGLGRLLGAWHDHPWVWSAGFLALLMLPGLLLRRRYGQGALSLASTGMVGMGADLLVLLLYQTMRGTLYLRVGLVVALFMAGLGLGALLGGRWREPSRRGRAILLSDLAWVLFLLAGIPLVGLIPHLGDLAAEGVLLALALLAGMLTGIPFPCVAAWIAERRGASIDRAAAGGIADAADHAGALFGALVTGIFLVPLIGFAGALVILAAVKLLSAAGWLVRPEHGR